MSRTNELRASWRVLSGCFLLALTSLTVHAQSIAVGGTEQSQNGAWELGLNRLYTRSVHVPGLGGDPANAAEGTLWYRRTVHLPVGDWSYAQLTLKGARFAPRVFINGRMVSSSGGGMAPTVHILRSSDVVPGATIVLEVALRSDKDLDPQDASKIPQPDLWRSDNSSGLWDDAILHFFKDARLSRVTPFTNWKARQLMVHWSVAQEGGLARNRTLHVTLLDQANKVVGASHPVQVIGASGKILIALGNAVRTWSPEHPVVYKLRVELRGDGELLDMHESSWGLRQFETINRRFYLNGSPIELRGGTVVWHRFLRNPEAATVAFDADWFARNVVLRLKGYGANMLRFHLGLPPERLLDLCDKYGLAVQLEWPFFHGVKASGESMREQWHAWLDVAMRHPSVVIVHPWNETDDPEELKSAWASLNAVLQDYPPLVVAHRDTQHIHKYWWSLFENLGLYYDSPKQFGKTVMVDEFGGNYLDQNGDQGLYPAIKDSNLRFLGRHQSRALRLEFNAESNARVAEYWRRLGAAGFAPFCILGSPQDGNTWFLDSLKDPRPMPVWDALAASYSPQSVSLEVWDRNYLPGQSVSLPVYFFNDTRKPALLTADVRIVRPDASVAFSKPVSSWVSAHGRAKTAVEVRLPDQAGDLRFEAVLRNRVEGVVHPIMSSWDIRTLRPAVPVTLAGALIAIPEGEEELYKFLKQNGLRTTAIDDPRARIVVTGSKSWKSIANTALQQKLDVAMERGQSVVMLDMGPRDLGPPSHKGELDTPDESPRIAPGRGYIYHQQLFAGVGVEFDQVPEPESHMQPGPKDESLWSNLPKQSTWLWNGLRGGLIIPAADMKVSGLGEEGFLAEWAQRGADPHAIVVGNYFAYELAGYYAFSTKDNDAVVIKALHDRVAFLVEDAPDLKNVINLEAKIEQIDLSREYREHAGGHAEQMIPLVTCGKGLTRTSIFELTFGTRKGNVILSQVLTAGRLVRGVIEPGLYGVRYDPATEQFVLNILAKAIIPDTASASIY